jgi:hypothetical protein
VGIFGKQAAHKKNLPGMCARILVFAVLFGLTVLFFMPLQRALHKGMTQVRNELIRGVEERIHRKIRYSSIRPSILGSFDIRNLRIEGENGGAPLLSVSRLRLSYSLIRLIQGKTALIRSARLDRPVVNIDREKDRDLAELFAGRQFLPPDREAVFELLPKTIGLRGGQFNLNDGLNRYQVQGINITVRSDGSEISLNGKWNLGIFLGALGTFLGEPFSAQIQMRAAGTCSALLDSGNAVITLASPDERLRIRPLNFGLALQDNRVSLKKLEDRQPFDFSAAYDIAEGDIDLRFDCSRFKPAEIMTFSGPWKGLNQWLSREGSGFASLERKEKKLTFHIDLAGGGDEDVSFAIRAKGDEDLVRVDAFRFSAPRHTPGLRTGAELFQGEFGFTGSIALSPLAPNGVMRLRDWSLKGGGGISAELTVSSQDTEINLFGETVILGETDLTALDISFFPARQDLGFRFSALRFRDRAYEDVSLGSFSLEGSMSGEGRQIEASLFLESFSLDDLANMISPFFAEPPPAFSRGLMRDVSITTEIFFTTDSEHILYNAPRFVIAYENSGGGNMVGMVSVSGTDQHFTLSEGRLIWDNNALLVSAYADYSKPEDINFSLMANYRDISWYFDGFLLDRKTLNVQGSYGFYASLGTDSRGAWSGYLEGREFPVPIRGKSAGFSFYAAFRYHDADFWSVDLDRLEAIDIASPAGSGHLRIAGALDQNGGSFPLLYYGDSLGPLSGRADFSWDKGFSIFSGNVSMEDAAGQERYFLNGSFINEHLEFLISGSAMRLDRFLYNAYNAQAEGELSISWNSVQSFKAELALKALNARIQDQDLSLSAQASLDGDTFTLRNLALKFANIESSMPLFTLSRAEQRVQGSAAFQGYAGGLPLDGALDLSARFRPIESWLEINQALNSISGAFYVRHLQYAASRTGEPFRFDFERGNGALMISGGPRNMLRLQMDREGNFYAGLSAPFPVRFSAAGNIRNNTIDLSCPDLYVDLAGLWSLLPPISDIALAGGYVNGALSVRGSLADPEFFGSAKGTSVRIQVPNYLTADIRPVPFTVSIDGNEMYFGPVPASVGRGAGIVDGWFRFDRWIPNVFAINIQVPRETPIPFGFDITGFLAHGDAAGKLTLSMEDMIFNIAGDLFANNTEMGLNTDEITQNHDIFSPEQKPVTVDLKITTGPTVEFFLPNSRFPLLRANPDIGTVVHVSVDTLGRQFSLNSDIKIRSGELFYFERSFYIRSGNLSFRETESRFNPLLTARAEVRDHTNEGPVTISLIVENSPLLSFVPRFESSPSLSQLEIFSLLGQNLTGVPGEKSSDPVQQVILNSIPDLLSQFVVVRQFERQVRNFLHLDMFSVRTQLLQNAVLSATKLGNNPVDRNSRVGNYFDNTTVFLGKYVGGDMFFQGMFSMRYDENQLAAGGLRFEPDIGVELQSPFFNIRWDFVPTHPENWWVNDNSITLTWSKSF